MFREGKSTERKKLHYLVGFLGCVFCFDSRGDSGILRKSQSTGKDVLCSCSDPQKSELLHGKKQNLTNSSSHTVGDYKTNLCILTNLLKIN